MVEGFIATILSIVGFTKFTGTSLDYKFVLEKEIISILATQDCGHAEILQNVPVIDDYAVCEAQYTVADIDSILDKVADFHRGDHFQEGKYQLNQTGWKLYDPVYMLHRAVVPRLVETANLRYANHVAKTTGTKQMNGLKLMPLPKMHDFYAPLLDILKSRVLHEILLVLLYKNLKKHQVTSGKVLSHTLFLLHWCALQSDSSTADFFCRCLGNSIDSLIDVLFELYVQTAGTDSTKMSTLDEFEPSADLPVPSIEAMILTIFKVLKNYEKCSDKLRALFGQDSQMESPGKGPSFSKILSDFLELLRPWTRITS